MEKVTEILGSRGLRSLMYSFTIDNQTELQSRSVFSQRDCCVWGFWSAFITIKLDTQAAIQLWITTIRSSFNICRSSMIMTYEIAARWWENDNQFPRPIWRITFLLKSISPRVPDICYISSVATETHIQKSGVNSFVWQKTLYMAVVIDPPSLNNGA